MNAQLRGFSAAILPFSKTIFYPWRPYVTNLVESLSVEQQNIFTVVRSG